MALLPSLLALGLLALISTLGAPGEALEAVSPIKYATLFPMIAVIVFLFCSAQAPELFGRDQGSGVLPLYFSRAVGRMDYASARVLGLYLSLAILVLVPYIVLLLGPGARGCGPGRRPGRGAAQPAGGLPRGRHHHRARR